MSAVPRPYNSPASTWLIDATAAALSHGNNLFSLQKTELITRHGVQALKKGTMFPSKLFYSLILSVTL